MTQQQHEGKTENVQEQEPVLKGESSTAPPDYYVRVTLTHSIPRHGPWPSIGDEMESVCAALRRGGVGILPPETTFHGDIITRVRTAKEVKQDAARAEKRRAARGY